MPFLFVAVEKSPPYAVAVYQIDEDARELGAALYRKDVNRIAEAKRTNIYSAYSDEIETINLPGWAYRGA